MDVLSKCSKQLHKEFQEYNLCSERTYKDAEDLIQSYDIFEQKPPVEWLKN